MNPKTYHWFYQKHVDAVGRVRPEHYDGYRELCGIYARRYDDLMKRAVQERRDLRPLLIAAE